MTFIWNHFLLLVTNNIFLACLSAWFCCQIIKTVFSFCKNRVESVKDFVELLLWRTGNMPSSHSSLVSCLTMSMILKHGVENDLSLICLAFYLIVVRDAVGVRKASGEQAKKINEIGEDLKNNGIDPNFSRLKEVHGHNALDVFVGSVIGVVFAVIFHIPVISQQM